MSTTQNTKDIRASPEKLYRACTAPDALAHWLAPGDMTGKMHSFELGVGAGYDMSLFYPASEKGSPGKTSDKEDRFSARFLELVPFRKIVQAITFHTSDPALAGEMILEIRFEAFNDSTRVTFLFRNIPPGIRPEDNEAGTNLSLEKLERYVTQADSV